MEQLPPPKKTKRKEREPDGFIQGLVPPHSKETEESMLGMMMLDRTLLEIGMGKIQASHFYIPICELIFRAMQSLFQRKEPTDLIYTFQECIRLDKESMKNPHFLTSITNNAIPSMSTFEEHGRLLYQLFALRELIRLGQKTVADAYAMVDCFDLCDSVQLAASNLALIKSSNVKNMVQVSSGFVQNLDRKIHNKGIMTGVPSGYVELDGCTFGFQFTDLIILAARPAVGKTAFALNLGRNAAGANIATAFFSLEMADEQLALRMYSRESGIRMSDLQRGNIDQEQRNNFNRAIATIEKLPLFIDDEAGINWMDLKTKLRRLVMLHAVKFVIIDYLQLMTDVNDGVKNKSREQQLANITRNLKQMAKELNVCIIALSQLSRATETRKGGNNQPQLSDLRESGAIEQDADLVMFLYRPEYYGEHIKENGSRVAGETHVKVAKHRNGSLGTFKLRAKLSIQSFHEMDDPTGHEIEEPMSNPAAAGWTKLSLPGVEDEEFDFKN